MKINLKRVQQIKKREHVLLFVYPNGQITQRSRPHRFFGHLAEVEK